MAVVLKEANFIQLGGKVQDLHRYYD